MSQTKIRPNKLALQFNIWEANAIACVLELMEEGYVLEKCSELHNGSAVLLDFCKKGVENG